MRPTVPPARVPAFNFRLKPETVADLDYVAGSLSDSTGVPHTRTDALRHAARTARIVLEKKAEKSGK